MNDICLPYVGAIIEKVSPSGVELLIQTRWKPERDPLYSGTFEFPAGVMDKPFENVYETLKREIREETGLNLLKIKNDSRTREYTTNRDDLSFGFKPFCCTQQLKNGKPWVGFVFLCEVEDGDLVPQETEVKDLRWVKRSEMESIFNNTPEKIFSLELPAWEYYFNS